MKKLWLRWIALVVFVTLLGALFIRLGEWQMHRLEWRRGENARVTTYQQQPVKPYEEVFAGPIGHDEQWQRVRVTGTYDAENQIQALYRSQNDQAGSEVFTPLKATDGRYVLVDRGFLPREQGGQEIAVLPDPPTGTVEVVGYVRRSENGKPAAMTPQDKLVRLVNAEELSKTLPYTLVDGYIGLVESKPEQSGGLLPMTTPELDEGPHLSYALQWFAFTVIAVGGVFVLIRNDLRDRKKAQARAERRAQKLASASAADTTAGGAGSSPAPVPEQSETTTHTATPQEDDNAARS
ncbi:SURF1 family cytochrome oxidase biogenesis protein [Luteococcus sp. Sow4_B9]|uniref:SURF1 family cytochrome oxidase biogenesis protein n=1 Tax=Luteococcus sp. Sow4_B9 TaxID=3438792 RepID=UPI003F9CE528